MGRVIPGRETGLASYFELKKSVSLASAERSPPSRGRGAAPGGRMPAGAAPQWRLGEAEGSWAYEESRISSECASV